MEAIATCEAEAQEYLRDKGVVVDEKSADADTMDRPLTIVKTEMGPWFDTNKREMMDLKRQAEWMREVSPDPG